jgi:hypothetical protein
VNPRARRRDRSAPSKALPVTGAALALALAVLPETSAAAESVAPPATEAVWLQTNLPQLYPSSAEICLATYEQMSHVPGVVVRLHTEVENFSHYTYTLQRDSLPIGAPMENRSGAIPVRFDPRSHQPQKIEAVIRAVSASGQTTRPFAIELGYYPTEHYAASGQHTRSWMVVHASDLAMCGSSVEDWIVERPSAADRTYARKRWGRLLKPTDSDYDHAKAIARDLVRVLRPHEGIPSDQMRFAPAFEQLARAERGQDHVWCSNYADIFSAACNALDVPVRKIDMQYVWSSKGKTNFEIAEGHRTTEVFDRELNRWIWMDLTFGYSGAPALGHVPLNMADLVRALDGELDRETQVRVVEYNDSTGTARVARVVESKRGKDLLRFCRQYQRYQYMRIAQAATR